MAFVRRVYFYQSTLLVCNPLDSHWFQYGFGSGFLGQGGSSSGSVSMDLITKKFVKFQKLKTFGICNTVSIKDFQVSKLHKKPVL
jgi:hypothetical protein